jgi:hypothetical protein
LGAALGGPYSGGTREAQEPAWTLTHRMGICLRLYPQSSYAPHARQVALCLQLFVYELCAGSPDFQSGVTMKTLSIAEIYSETDLDRRKRSRRALDLGGAYNDGEEPTPLSLSNGIVLYGGIAWIAITSAIGTILVLKGCWSFLAMLWMHA